MSIEQITRLAVGLARGLDPNLSTNNRGKIARRAQLEGVVMAVDLLVDRDTFQRFIDAVIEAEPNQEVTQ